MVLLIVLYSQLLCFCVGDLHNNTLMTGGSLGMAFRASSLRFQSSFSVVSCWSVVSKKTGSSCAMPVDSMYTSIGFVGLSSLIFKIIFSIGSFAKRDKKLLRSSFCLEAWKVCNSKIKLQYKIASLP